MVDEEESPLTQWNCSECGYKAMENEKQQKDCPVCKNAKYCVRLIESEGSYLWCHECGRIAQ